MNFYTNQHKFYCGIDLHANKMYVCILDSKGDILLHRNMATDRKQFLRIIEPYQEDVAVAVECIFTWYWIADLCRDNDIPFVLGHALYMKAIHGGKAKNDKIDSRKIAVLLRGGMIPTAYVYPPKMRATRDLLRRRTHFMRKRAELFTHIQNTGSQYNIGESLGRVVKSRNRDGILEHFSDPSAQKNIKVDLIMIEAYDQMLGKLEWEIVKNAKIHNPVSYTLLKTIPGVGKILGLVLLYEIENIKRFPRVQNFASYCRLIKCIKESNGKRYGTSGKKIGNAHLKWAFSEAAALSLRCNAQGQTHHKRLVKKHGKAKALSILAHKLGNATYFMLKNTTPFNREKFYGL
jgi:transposase